jgi:hypothetical protein
VAVSGPFEFHELCPFATSFSSGVTALLVVVVAQESASEAATNAIAALRIARNALVI